MRKVKLQLPTGDWGDLTTKYPADDNRKVDQNAFTDGTKNIDTESDGTIRKMKGGTEFYTLVSAAKDQHEAIFSDGTRHLLTVDGGDLRYTAGTPTSTSVTSGYSTAGNFEFATTQDRVYFGNGINANQVYDKTASYGGVGYSVPQTKVMGAQTPSSAPTAALGAAGSNVPAGGHTYKVTFLYYGSEESNGSSSSNLVTVTGANEQVDLTSVPIGGYGVTARKIYRDDNDGVYVLVGTISNNTATIFSDTVAAGTTPIPTDNGIPPTFGLTKLFLDRLWFAQISGEPFTVYFSEVGLPDIVQSTNFIDANPEDPITGLAVYRGRLIIFNRKSMGQILGDTKDSFRYESIQGSNNQAIGCVDTRTIQEVVLQGVPILVWLSDRGFYGFNGSSIFYLSDNIEDLVNVNIKQAVIQKNQNVDTTDADFTAGTSSDGIAIAGGQVSVRGYVDGTGTVGSNPRRTWNDTADWDGGDSLDNISTIDQANELTIVDDFSEEPGTEGAKDGVIADGIGIKLETSAPFIGESSTGGAIREEIVAGGFPPDAYKVAWSFTPTKSGTLSTINFEIGFDYLGVSPTLDYTLKVWADSSGIPGAEVATGTLQSVTPSFVSGQRLTISGGFVGFPVLDGGTKYHFGLEFSTDTSSLRFRYLSKGTITSGGERQIFNDAEGWITPTVSGDAGSANTASYQWSSAPVAKSGTWTSSIFDTQSGSADPTTITFTSATGGVRSTITTINAGDELDFAGNIIIDETQSFNDHTGTDTVTLGSRRYYQIIIVLSTTDDLSTPTVTTSVDLAFSTTAEWISEAIDTTGDSTVYNTLTTTATTPGSSTVVTEIRTAATLGALSGATWFSFGAHSVNKYAQIRLTLTKDGSNLPSVSELELTWTIVSNIISAEIDTNVTPSGWDIFQTDFTTNSGTVVFEMRSAASSGALSGATWYTVTNGNYPPAGLPVLQFVQWRATITATDIAVPTVSSVTISWLVGTTDSVRAASIFFNKNYYVALAEFGNDENNIILQLDATGKWRKKEGLGVSTLGFFFNDPYFGKSTSGVIGKFLEGLTDLGTNIEVDIRTRAFDYSTNFFDNSEFTKVPESVIIEGRGTGAAYDVSYSFDRGQTFTSMIDVQTGNTVFTTADDDELFRRVFRAPDNSGDRTIVYRIHTNDASDVKLHRVKATAFLTQREPITTG